MKVYEKLITMKRLQPLAWVFKLRCLSFLFPDYLHLLSHTSWHFGMAHSSGIWNLKHAAKNSGLKHLQLSLWMVVLDGGCGGGGGEDGQ